MWQEILKIQATESRSDWIFSARSQQRFFRLQQSNAPAVGRVIVAQKLGETYSDLLRFPASLTVFSLFFPYESGLGRELAIKWTTLKNIPVSWQLTLFEFHPTEGITEEFYLGRIRNFTFIPLEVVGISQNILNPQLIDTNFWVPVNSFSPYSVGRFYTDEGIISDPLIHSPLSLEGFRVSFSGKAIERRQIKVAIFKA